MQQQNGSTTVPSVKAVVAPSSSSVSTPRTALILYGSETGNAHDVAEEVSRLTQTLHFESVVLDLDSVQLRDLLKFKIVIFVVSTAGQGEFPQNARTIWKALLSAALKPGTFRRLLFTSFGLGDSSYPRYNVAHRMLHGRLLQLGAQSFCERGEGNEQHPEGHSAGLREWIIALKTSLLSTFPLHDALLPLADGTFIEPRYKLAIRDDQAGEAYSTHVLTDQPSQEVLPLVDGFLADVVQNERVTASDHFQDVRLYDLRLDRTYDYGPGAVAVIYPKNFPEDVQSFITLMKWEEVADLPLELLLQPSKTILSAQSPLRHFELAKITLTLRWLLENVLDIMSIPRRSFFATLAYFAGDADDDQAYQRERLLELANPELIDELWDYTTRPKRTILEVMMDFTTVRIPWQYALSTLPVMRGRQFSIASGGRLTKDDNGRTRVQLLVAIVDPPSPIIKWRRRYGVCTRYMAGLRAGQQISVHMQQGYLDVQPSELAMPVIMIGPGTGVAPMRAMIQQRLAWSQDNVESSKGHLQDDVLFFGCRSATADNFFHDEWQLVSDEAGLHVFTAFSRDATQPKQYVQDQIRDHSSLVAKALLERQGKVYVCGSSGNMPKGVRVALAEALSAYASSMSQHEAEAYLNTMEKAGRYKQETW